MAGPLFAYSVLAATGFPQSEFSAQPEIPGVIAAGTRLQLVKGGFQRNTEGPIGTPDGGLYFTDIEGNRIYKLDKTGGVSIWRENTNRTNGLYWMTDGRLLCAEGNGPRIISLNPDGKVTPLATSFGGKPSRQPNDLIADKRWRNLFYRSSTASSAGCGSQRARECSLHSAQWRGAAHR